MFRLFIALCAADNLTIYGGDTKDAFAHSLGLEVINHTPARLFFLEESLWAEQSIVSIRNIECLSGNSPSSAEDISDRPRDSANSLNVE